MTARDVILDRFNRGDLARAYDLCQVELSRRPDDLWLRHRSVLCLIRSGALERAEQEYRAFRLGEARHDEDCLALGARLLKAFAMEASPSEFAGKARNAASCYGEVFAQTRGHYTGINAASMYLLAGDAALAADYARQVLAISEAAPPEDAEAAYYQLASRAEAYLLLGNSGAANMALRAAMERDPQNHLAHATTLRQLRLVASARGVSAPWLETLAPPRPAHFAGHIFPLGDGPGALDPAAEASLADMLDRVIAEDRIGSVYGAVAAGADIMIAEAALRAGCDLAVVLPVPAQAFIDTSVRPYGDDWLRRCEACLDAASDIKEATTERRIVSELNLNHASAVAMGLARMRAEVLVTSPRQILLYDGQGDTATSGTGHDARAWAAAGLEQRIIPFSRPDATGPADTPPRPDGDGFEPAMRAMLFLDVRGSSRVPDDRIASFVNHVLGALAACCEALEVPALYSDSWGDGMFLVFDRVEAAADAATELRKVFEEVDMEALALPDTLGLRIAGHYGPVHIGTDPLQKRRAPFGGQVAIAARIEQASLPGAVCVSEPFAAVLAMSSESRFRCEYLGRMEVDPLIPELPLYALRAVAPGSQMDSTPGSA